MSDFARVQEMARAAGVQINPPSVLTVPNVSPETAVVGDMLSCTTGTWNGAPTGYAYAWKHIDDPTEIGAGDTYTTVAGDADTSVRCVVSASNSAGTVEAPPSNFVVVTAAAARRTTEHRDAAAPADSRRK